jgi:C-terminal processing protease CtpA/Prc
MMIGELNASHSGINPPGRDTVVATGHLGVRFDRAEYESAGRLKITEVLPLTPAEIYGLKVSEYITAVDGVKIDAHTNLDALLDYKIDKRVTLTVSKSANGDSRKVALKPINRATDKGITYRTWVNANRDYVNKVSGGKLGYVHMFDMGSGSLNQLFIDLDAENHTKKGVVIDVRNNNGGFVNAYALDVLARRGYMTMTFRGFPAAPARTILGQRSLELPTILVTNQHSLSDAEDFTEGYRTLKLGKVVGEPTAGWIIYTSNVNLIDGSVIRLPFIRITGADGKDMEMHPRQVDVPVSRQLGEPKLNKDSQLDTAVSELLKHLGESTSKQ